MSFRIDVPPLTAEEAGQLKDLLTRYLAHHAAGFANRVIDTLIANFRRAPALVESTKRRRPPKTDKGNSPSV